MKTYFTKKEALETVIAELNNFEEHYEELFQQCFNSDYYIIGIDEATQALEQYGVFKVISEILKFEEENFGNQQINREEITNPEKLANYLWYIIGCEVMGEIDPYNTYYDDKATESKNKEIKNFIFEMLESGDYDN